MGRYQQARVRQLDFDSDEFSADFTPKVGTEHRTLRPVQLCVVCWHHRAHLRLAPRHGHAPAKLCLRCHHAVMQQRKMLRADLPATDQTSLLPVQRLARAHHFSGDVGLIVPPGRPLSAKTKHDVLNHRRRRAQVAARRALNLLDCVN